MNKREKQGHCGYFFAIGLSSVKTVVDKHIHVDMRFNGINIDDLE